MEPRGSVAMDEHVTRDLPAYAGDTLGQEDRRRVLAHLKTCETCRTELDSWQAVSMAAKEVSSRLQAPPEDLMERVWTRIEGEAPAAYRSGRLSLGWQLLVSQVALVRREIWVASAATMALGCLVALLTAGASAGGVVLSVFAPMIAAVGVAFIYGHENDPSLEVALSTPTPPRLVLLARLILVYGYDLALALAATVALALASGGVGLLPLISLWIGPMLFLSALALLLSLIFGSTAAMLVALGLWGGRLLAYSSASRGVVPSVEMRLLESFWQSTSLLLPLAVLLIVFAVLYAPRQRRFSREWRA